MANENEGAAGGPVQTDSAQPQQGSGTDGRIAESGFNELASLSSAGGLTDVVSGAGQDADGTHESPGMGLDSTDEGHQPSDSEGTSQTGDSGEEETSDNRNEPISDEAGDPSRPPEPSGSGKEGLEMSSSETLKDFESRFSPNPQWLNELKYPKEFDAPSLDLSLPNTLAEAIAQLPASPEASGDGSKGQMKSSDQYNKDLDKMRGDAEQLQEWNSQAVTRYQEKRAKELKGSLG